MFLFSVLGLNQIGAPVLAKKEELVRILKNNSIDSNKLGKTAEGQLVILRNVLFNFESSTRSRVLHGIQKWC